MASSSDGLSQALRPSGVHDGYVKLSPGRAFALGVGLASVIWLMRLLPPLGHLQAASALAHKFSAEFLSESQSLVSDLGNLCVVDRQICWSR